jgi:hypothetical protein
MTQEVPINDTIERVTIYLDNKDTNIDCIVKDIDTNKQIKPRDREYARKYAKEYYSKNKQKIRQILSAKVTCDCGKVVSRHGLISHKRKKIHMERMKDILRNKFKSGEPIRGGSNLEKVVEEDDILDKLIKILKL